MPSAGSQPTTSVRGSGPPSARARREHLHRVHAVRVERHGSSVARSSGSISDSVPGGCAARRGVERARPRRSPRRARRRGPCRGSRSRPPRRPAGASRCASRSATATPKPSSPRKTLPMPATSTRAAAAPAIGSTSSGAKKKRWPGWRALAEVAARIVLDASRRGARSPSRSSLDRLDDGDLAGERHDRTRRRRRAGAARTRLPRRSSTPRRRPIRARAAAAPPSVIAPSRARGSPPCRRISSSVGQRLGALEDLARARVGVAHLGLLLVGQAEDVEHEHLVDLAAVEQVAGALGRDPRVVLEDDRRGEHRVALAGLADEHRPRALVAARAAASRSARGRIGQRDERARRARAGPRGWSRTCARSASSRSSPSERRRVRDLDGEPRSPRATRLGARPRRARRAPRQERTIAPAAPSGSSASPGRDRDRHAPPAPERQLALGGLVPGRDGARRRRPARRPARRRASTWRAHDVQEAHAHVDVARRRPRAGTRCCIVPAVVGMALAVRRAGTRRRRSSGAGSSAPSGGRATARSPRRAPRRRSRGPGHAHSAPPSSASTVVLPASGARAAPCRRRAGRSVSRRSRSQALPGK